MRIMRTMRYAAAAVGFAVCVPVLLGQAAPSLLDQPPSAPNVSYAAGKLTIQATNSSLRAILDDLKARTGATVEGLGKDERIFGVYGPGAPQEVLAALLDDSGYNVLIAGRRPDGTPREIVLSSRAGAGGSPAPAQTPTQSGDDADDGSDVPEQPPQPQPALFGPTGPNGPGGPGNGGNPGQNGQPVKTPQQILEELQRLRQTQPPSQ